MKPIALRISRRVAIQKSASSRPPRLGLRIRVLCRRWRLDYELAAGGARDAPEDRALRARQLADPVTRRRVSGSLRRVVAEAEQPRTLLLSPAVPVLGDVVVPRREALLGLAERLEQPVPTNPCGVARALVLLTNGAGPLYNRASERPIDEVIWWVADGLQSCPPHDWECPVIVKLDPDHVAWTCAHCGVIGTSEDPAVRPD
ncbi:MAG: hypothetical protein ACLQMH_09440 [Solirubrobacteraceae bacterium]